MPSVATTDFPPSFDGNPWTYGFALFGLTVVASLCVAQLGYYWFEGRAKRAAHGFGDSTPEARWNTLTVHRAIVSGFLITILMGALPDVLVLLAWGETSIQTMETLYALDRVCDGALLAPFLTASFCSAWASQVIPQQLKNAASVSLMTPRWWMVKDRVRIVLVSIVIAIGVTIGKAGA